MVGLVSLGGVLAGQKAVVTAGASGIGRAIAECFLAAGAVVHICDVSPENLDAALSEQNNLTGTLADVSRPVEVEQLFAAALDRLGGLDILVNNAGIGGPRGGIADITYEEWDRTIAVNLSGMFYCIKNAVPRMKTQQSGCIINISTSSVRTGLPLRTAYVTAKQGVMGLTQNLARELGSDNIRCNAILPGLIDNDRGRMLVTKYAEERDITEAEAEANFLKYISLKSWISPEEIGETAVFLASRAGRHISGQFLAVDGNFEWEE
tara:strand:+ start:4822 stop:5616 length:795 start_codon:yes stop_codon:yes gene_type:complete